jgi:hypothetical protein
MSPKRNPKFKIALFLLIPSAPLRLLRVETRSMDLENLYLTPCFSHDDHLTAVEYIKPQNTESACTTREKETDSKIGGGTHIKIDKKK